MKRAKNFKIQKESFEDMQKARRFNPCLEITFCDRSGLHTHKIGAGYQDEIHVYRYGDQNFVLSKNNRLGYIGLEVFSGSEKKGELFLESHEVGYILKRYDLAPFTIIKRLRDYLI